MSLVSAKCPNCGASIQLDNERAEAFCSYCGSKVEVQKAINLIKIDKSENLQNYIDLAMSAINGKNGEEAYIYANKALEIDSSNEEAWFLKMLSLNFLGTLQDMRVDEIIMAGYNAIEYSSGEKENAVYVLFLNKCLGLLQFSTNELLDCDWLKNLYNNLNYKNFLTSTQEALNADTMRDSLINVANEGLKCRFAVPTEKILQNPSFVTIADNIAKQWVQFTNAVNVRFNACGTSMSDDTVLSYRETLNSLKEVLPEANSWMINEDEISNPDAGINWPTVFMWIFVIIVAVLLLIANLN